MNSNLSPRKRVRVCGILVDAMTLAEVFKIFDDIIEQKGNGRFVSFCDAHQCVQATRIAEVGAVLEKATLVLPNGVGLTVGARLLGERLPQRLQGSFVMYEYCRHGLAKGHKHFFYGGSDGVAERLKNEMCRKIPGLKVVGTYCPPFRPLTPEEEAAVKREIEESGADIVWVGLGAPKQEKWAADHVGKINVPLYMPVGAAFDFLSGTRKRAPVWIQKAGFEWVYRMLTGGRRVFMRNAKSDSTFAWLIVKQAIKKQLGYQE